MESEMLKLGQVFRTVQLFIEAARKAGCSEDEAVFDENLKKIARHKPPAAQASAPRKPSSK
jgi:hypothetical protein